MTERLKTQLFFTIMFFVIMGACAMGSFDFTETRETQVVSNFNQIKE